MTIELFSGPNDGLVLEAPCCVPLWLSVPTELYAVRAIYQSACRCGCHHIEEGKLRYYFCGYDVANQGSPDETAERQAPFKLPQA